MKIITIIIALFYISILHPQEKPKKETPKKTEKVFILKEVKVPSKPSTIETDPEIYTKGIKTDDKLFETFMLLNIYTEQRKTNRILQNIEKEKTK